jgi:hypothetical protein
MVKEVSLPLTAVVRDELSEKVIVAGKPAILHAISRIVLPRIARNRVVLSGGYICEGF